MARRKVDIFSMSFLDAICCGFGAVVLLFMLITAQSDRFVDKVTSDLRSEALLIEQQVLAARRNLVEARNSSDLLERSEVVTRGLSERVLREIDERREELSTAQEETLARKERLERLKADLAALEEGTRRLEAQAQRPPGGEAVRKIERQGDRMYLTGLRVGGQRILVLLDTSASMMDDTVVNIIRLRNMPEEARRRAVKWQQTLAITEWLATQLPPGAEFQILTFDTQARPLVEGTDGQWLRVDGPNVDRALRQVRQIVPQNGNSLENAFVAIRTMNPQPDNVILITDGLPTQGASPPRRNMVDGTERLRNFERAVAQLPRRVPVTTILLPMEGDPAAANAYWRLAKGTGGSFLSPARDWPWSGT